VRHPEFELLAKPHHELGARPDVRDPLRAHDGLTGLPGSLSLKRSSQRIHVQGESPYSILHSSRFSLLSNMQREQAHELNRPLYLCLVSLSRARAMFGEQANGVFANLPGW
jgi:hypothetical protein